MRYFVIILYLGKILFMIYSTLIIAKFDIISQKQYLWEGERTMKEKVFSLKTAAGCRRLLTLLFAIIMVSSCIAQMISSSVGKIKIESIQIDPRGAELSGDLYYPAGTTDEDSYPAVILAPGAGVIKEQMRGFAEELALRGYVVLNLNPYGSGLSETPVYNENDMGVLEYNIFATPLGVLDAVNYMRTVEFVDANRIGLSGHSQGSRRCGYAALMDCGYYTFNDVLLIMLNESFGLDISADDINTSADTIAQQRLSAAELTLYEQLKESYRQDYDHMVKSICLIGSTAQFCNPTAVVEVAGNEVTRTCKMNQCVINGNYDFGYLGFNNDPATKVAWYIPETEDIVNEAYYALDDLTGTSQIVGMFRQDTILSNTALKEAIANRSLRVVMTTPETHSKNFFSTQTTARVIDYFNQTLDNNASKVSTGKGEMVFMWREFMNLIALLAMVAMVLPVTGMLTLNAKYSACVENNTLAAFKEPKKYIFPLLFCLTVVTGFLSVYFVNANKNIFSFKTTPAFPGMITVWTTPNLLAWLTVFSIALVIVYLALTRDIASFVDFVKSNFRIGLGNILRGIGAAAGFIAVGYIALGIIEYFFQQDFHYWMAVFSQLKASHWMYVLSHALLCLPFFFIISLGVNYLSNVTLSGKSTLVDTVLTVVSNSLGLWLCCLVNIIMAYGGLKTDDLFSSFILSYGTLLVVPINCFILRMTYKQTRNIWVGIIACSLLAGWLMISVSGFNGSYVPTTWMSVFLGT